jgi:hypothetical protein
MVKGPALTDRPGEISIITTWLDLVEAKVK